MKVAIYVQRRYSKPTYKVESYDARIWSGIEMVADVLRRSGQEVGYCCDSTVAEQDVALVSVTGQCDWYSFIRERVRWPKGTRTTIVGGAAVLNIEPFLEYADCFVFGRGEGLIVPLVEGIAAKERFRHESVVWADEYNRESPRRIMQTDGAYPHSLRLSTSGDKRLEEWSEPGLGCRRKCLFCAVTWHRRHIESGGVDCSMGYGRLPKAYERTFWDLDLDNPPSWHVAGRLKTIGMDGFSERLRVGIGKPITNDMLFRFLSGLSRSGVVPGHFKLFNIVGYPSETEEDWREFYQVLEEADAASEPCSPLWFIELHSTPFRAMPATPCVAWPMSCKNCRGRIKRFFAPQSNNAIFYNGKSLVCIETKGTESFPTCILDWLALRGTGKDAGTIRRIATTPAFWSANTAKRLATLKDVADLEWLGGHRRVEELPTHGLRSYSNTPAIAALGDRALSRLMGRGKADEVD